MILDLDHFLRTERPYWLELQSLLQRLEEDPRTEMTCEQTLRFHYLYQRASGDLARIMMFAAEPAMRSYLESLVSRAYAEIHETRSRPHRLNLRGWLWRTFPRVFRKHLAAFGTALASTLLGLALGGLAITLDPAAKSVLMPFPELQGDPSDRVAAEEQPGRTTRLEGLKARFSGQLMTHNIRVSIFTLALGMTWGLGTIILLFYNGVILGAVSLDYINAGQTPFLLGWLLPHGVIEIPAILLAGQAGLVLAGALMGWGDRNPVRSRLSQVWQDLLTLIGGVAIMLVWAGIVEAFFSQYHEPAVPYALKIGFGGLELLALLLYLSWAGRDEKGG
ncbi:MAG: stage II sporulation protein M [Acidobacteriota bacterium]